MKTFTLVLLLCIFGGRTARCQQFHLSFAPSPGDALDQVSGYVAAWAPTNLPPTNGWNIFARTPAGITNVIVPLQVPSPSLIIVWAKSTNGALSTNMNNFVTYNTNAAWGLISNLYTPPTMPSALLITNQ